MNKEKIKKYFLPSDRINAGLTLVFIAFSFWLLAIKNPSMLKWYEEMSLFESNRLFLRSFLYYPGGILRYAGTYLTQFLYYPYLGAALLILLWLFMAWMTAKAFRFFKSLYPFTLLVPVCLLVSVVQLDEAWLSLKTPGYIFSNTLGYLFTLSLTLLFKTYYRKRALAYAIALIIPCLYHLLGFYALLAALLCFIDFIARGIKKREYLCFAMAVFILLLIVVIPQIYYLYFHGNTVDNDYLYLKGLPELVMLKCDVYLWMPFIVAGVIIILYGLISDFSSGALEKSKIMNRIGLVMVAAGLVWSVTAERKSEQLRATILMLRHIEHNNWQGVLNVMSRIKETPNYTMLVLTNLANANLGGKTIDVSQIRMNDLDARHSESFTTTAFVQVPVNYYIGRFNQSYRWAMEHTVQYGKRVFFLKYMVKDALLRGDLKLAKKYNDILLKTRFHKEWAEDMNRYIEHPEFIETNREFKEALRLGEKEKKRELSL